MVNNKIIVNKILKKLENKIKKVIEISKEAGITKIGEVLKDEYIMADSNTGLITKHPITGEPIKKPSEIIFNKTEDGYQISEEDRIVNKIHNILTPGKGPWLKARDRRKDIYEAIHKAVKKNL